MTARKIILRVAVVLGLLAFTAGLYELMMMRFEAGDLYPPYSTLRTDPQGAKAIYQGLEELPGLSVSRNYRPLEKTAGGAGKTILLLGAGSVADLEDDSFSAKGRAAALEQFVSAGGRLVITLSPKSRFHLLQRDLAGLDEKFGFEISGVQHEEVYTGPLHLFPATAKSPRPRVASTRPFDARKIGPAPSWQSPFWLETTDAAWSVACESAPGKAALMERPYGKGSVVVAADSYFLSNEALLKERRPRLLAWLIGGPEVVFDETHLGVAEGVGVASLARKYNLTGLFLAMMVVAALLIWKNAATFVPRDPARAAQLSGVKVWGRGSAAGLVNLLRRSIPRSEIVPTCFSEWVKSAPARRRVKPAAVRQIQQIIDAQDDLPKRKQDPLWAYRMICGIVSERK
ncbi:MAG: DUF4350 domain-containing protein [Phycisphaerae bacterium]